MAITFATPRTHQGENHDGLSKDDLVGDLIVVTFDDYAESIETSYGTTQMAKLSITVVDGEHAGQVDDDFAVFGNLARQIEKGIDVGDTALGRIESGTSANGRSWFGIAWSTDPADHASARKALGEDTAKAPRKKAAATEAPF